MTVMDVSDTSMSSLDDVSGSAIAESFVKNTMTVEFNNLKMSGSTLMGGTAANAFNGTAIVQFESKIVIGTGKYRLPAPITQP